MDLKRIKDTTIITIKTILIIFAMIGVCIIVAKVFYPVLVTIVDIVNKIGLSKFAITTTMVLIIGLWLDVYKNYENKNE
jgi:hypothetical protein